MVDRSPGAHLPVAGGAGETRLDRALELVREQLGERADPGDRVRWVSPFRAPFEGSVGESPPAPWLAAERWPAPRPRWEEHDVPGALWVTDRTPARMPNAAGLVSAGGAPVPGPVGAGRAWDGERLVAVGGEPARVRIDGGLPEPVRRVTRVWAEAAGHALVGGGDAELTVRLTAGVGGRVEATCGRDGWSASGAWRPLAPRADRPEEAWLVDTGGAVVVASTPGAVDVALEELGEPSGDPAAFALSWAELFERALLPGPGVVALEHRLAAKPAFLAPAAPPGAVPAPGERHVRLPLDAALALAGAAMAVVGLLLRR